MDELLMAPPEVLMGEAGLCGFWAMVAVAHVYNRNQKMNGWQTAVSDEARLAAAWWRYLPDVSWGARHVFSRQDLNMVSVREIVRATGPPRARFRCRVGGLAFY